MVPMTPGGRRTVAPPFVAGLIAAAAALASGTAGACACGCGVFDVGVGANFPDGGGGQVFTDVALLDQDRNWSGTSRAPTDANEDKRVRTTLYTFGAQYFLNRAWGVQVDVPYWDRRFTTTDEETGAPVSFRHAALGDVRLRALYTGFSPDQSSGVSFGVKLATGDASYRNFDADTQIGSGSTDLLLGAYHRGRVVGTETFSYFLRLQGEAVVHHRDNYRPGGELVAAAGIHHRGISLGPDARLVPLVQLTATWRGHDGGPDGRPQDTGYSRLIAAPGLELSVGRMRAYAEAGFSVHDNVSGNQLVARRLFRVNLSWGF
jgi:hypothetical protein